MTVYLDHAAGTPLHPAAAEAMQEWLTRAWGNPSGGHSVARRAREAVEEARDVVAEFMGVAPGGVVFTSGGTEADNLAVLGPLRHRPGAVAVSAVEHPAVIESGRAASGDALRVLGVGPDGKVDLEALGAALDPTVTVVSVQTANHETGVLQDLARIGRAVRKRAPKAVFHTDAVQAAPWLDLVSATAPADLVTISAHKFGGPQGVGALGIRHDVAVGPILYGGGQERERRSGTHNVAAIAGMAAAVTALRREGAEDAERVGQLRDRLVRLVVAAVPGAVVTAPEASKVPGHGHFRFPGVESETLLFLLDEQGVCASAGAACASGALEPSPVLLAMGVDKDDAGCALRLTLGTQTTEADVTAAADAVAAAVSRLRGF